MWAFVRSPRANVGVGTDGHVPWGALPTRYNGKHIGGWKALKRAVGDDEASALVEMGGGAPLSSPAAGEDAPQPIAKTAIMCFDGTCEVMTQDGTSFAIPEPAGVPASGVMGNSAAAREARYTARVGGRLDLHNCGVFVQESDL